MEKIFALNWLYIEIVIVTVLVISFLFYLLSKKVSKVNQLSHQLEKIKDQSIKDFLAREIEISKKTLIDRRQHKEKAPSVLRALSLRRNLLSIELECLEDDGGSPSKIDKIIQQLTAYFKISPWLRSTENKPSSEEAIQHSMTAVEKNRSRLSALIDVQRETIIELREKLSTRGMCETEVAQLGEVVDTGPVDELKKNLEDGKKNYQDLKRRFETLISQDASKESVDKKEDVNLLVDKILAEASTKYNAALDNLENIRQVNNEKRNYLDVIEEDYKKNNSIGSKDENEIPEAIAKLKLQLRDSEMCTAVLESEAESLRDQLNKMRLQKSEWQAKTNKPEGISSEENFIISVLKAIEETSAAENNTDVEKAIIQLFSSIKTSFFAIITTKGFDRWITSSETVSDDMKNIIRGVRADQNQQWISVPQGNVFVLKNIRCLLPLDFKYDLSHLAGLLLVASNRLISITQKDNIKKQKAFLSQLIEKTKESIENMDTNNKKLSEEGREAFSSFLKDISMFLNGLGLTERQQGLFSQIEGELLSQMESILEKRNSMDNSLEKIVELLNEEYSQTSSGVSSFRSFESAN